MFNMLSRISDDCHDDSFIDLHLLFTEQLFQPTLHYLQSLITPLQFYKVCQLDFITSAHRADHPSLTQHSLGVELTFATHTLLTPPCSLEKRTHATKAR